TSFQFRSTIIRLSAMLASTMRARSFGFRSRGFLVMQWLLPRGKSVLGESGGTRRKENCRYQYHKPLSGGHAPLDAERGEVAGHQAYTLAARAAGDIRAGGVLSAGAE